MTIGTSASMLSTGVFRRKPDVESAPPRPSIPGRPPPPPSIGSTTWTCRWPVSRSWTDATIGEIAPAGAAGTRPGSAWARAPSTASNTRRTVPYRTPIGAGNWALTTLPGGAVTRTGRRMLDAFGMPGSSVTR